MFYNSPETVIRKAALGKETVDMRIPFQGSAENVQDADRARDEISAFIQLIERPENDAGGSLARPLAVYGPEGGSSERAGANNEIQGDALGKASASLESKGSP